MLSGSQSLPPHTTAAAVALAAAAAAAKAVAIDVSWWGVVSDFPLPCPMPNFPGVRLRGRRRRDGHVQHRRGTVQF